MPGLFFFIALGLHYLLSTTYKPDDADKCKLSRHPVISFQLKSKYILHYNSFVLTQQCPDSKIATFNPHLIAPE